MSNIHSLSDTSGNGDPIPSPWGYSNNTSRNTNSQSNQRSGGNQQWGGGQSVSGKTSKNPWYLFFTLFFSFAYHIFLHNFF